MPLLTAARNANRRLRSFGVGWRFRLDPRICRLRIAEVQLELFPLNPLKRKRKRRPWKPQVIHQRCG